MSRVWRSLSVIPSELRLNVTLLNGQSFGWRRASVTNEYLGVIGRSVLRLRESKDDCEWAIEHNGSNDEKQTEAALRDYLSLHVTPSLSELYTTWSKDANFAKVAQPLQGVRVLRQDPFECLISFICSSNNQISRITSMLTSLRTKYGEKLCAADGHDFYSFPSVERLAEVEEQELRDLGFGYRAGYVTKTARQVAEKGEGWLRECRQLPRKEVQDRLVSLHGVGKKVADCVALFSMDKLEVVPVDTHVYQIARRHYRSQLPAGSGDKFTGKAYDVVGQIFERAFGSRAGWAHSVLFTAELPAFRALLPDSVAKAMQAVRDEEKQGKKEAKAKKKDDGKAAAAGASESGSGKEERKTVRNASAAAAAAAGELTESDEEMKAAGAGAARSSGKKRARESDDAASGAKSGAGAKSAGAAAPRAVKKRRT